MFNKELTYPRHEFKLSYTALMLFSSYLSLVYTYLAAIKHVYKGNSLHDFDQSVPQIFSAPKLFKR